MKRFDNCRWLSYEDNFYLQLDQFFKGYKPEIYAMIENIIFDKIIIYGIMVMFN